MRLTFPQAALVSNPVPIPVADRGARFAERIPWIGERRTPAGRKTSPALAYVSYVTPDRLSIYRDRTRDRRRPDARFVPFDRPTLRDVT